MWLFDLLSENVATAPGEGVGVLLTEDVTHPTAGYYLEGAVALPDPEGYLEVLPSPHLHLHVVPAHVVEPLPVYAEQASRYHRRPVIATC